MQVNIQSLSSHICNFGISIFSSFTQCLYGIIWYAYFHKKFLAGIKSYFGVIALQV